MGPCSFYCSGLRAIRPAGEYGGPGTSARPQRGFLIVCVWSPAPGWGRGFPAWGSRAPIGGWWGVPWSSRTFPGGVGGPRAEAPRQSGKEMLSQVGGAETAPVSLRGSLRAPAAHEA